MTSDDGISPLIYLLWQSRKKIVFDADALNIIARKKFEKRSSVGIMTPHEGEMERLRTAYGIKEGESKFSQAIELADKTGNVVVLKGNRTVVASPNGKINLNMSGSNTLASAGTGDVLAGLIVSLFAQGLDAFSAAILGVYLHGKAAERNGNTAFSADKLVELLRV
jgi:NAD(P)H-hydrate epimerase